MEKLTNHVLAYSSSTYLLSQGKKPSTISSSKNYEVFNILRFLKSHLFSFLEESVFWANNRVDYDFGGIYGEAEGLLIHIANFSFYLNR
jgi:hypothetical protein